MTITSHPLYCIWQSMRQRCLNPNAQQYPNYGARGITICDRWDDFALFLEDMGERPECHSLDRIDNNGNYEPSNCRWTTTKVQNNNRRMRAVVTDNTMNCIRKVAYGYRVSITLKPKSLQHHMFFSHLDEAILYRDLLDYERTFYRSLL